MQEPYAVGRRGQRVLIVAPDEDARSMLAFLLRAEGFNVFCLADAARAKTLLSLCRGPVLVVLDASVSEQDRPPWFHLLSQIAQVRGVVMTQRPGIAAKGIGPRPPRAAGVPCVTLGHPLQIATLVRALRSVAARAERELNSEAPGRADAAQRGSGEAPVERPRPA